MPGTRYQCAGRKCDHERVIPERPSDAPTTVRLGCQSCGYIREHYRVGDPPPYRPAGAGCPTSL